MDEPVYTEPLEARSQDGESQLRGRPFGPAGVSAVELPDGTLWEVDHADPSRLVLVALDGDLDRSVLLRDLLGPERFDLACAQLDAQRAAKAAGSRLRADVRSADGAEHVSGPRNRWHGAAHAVGSAILAADLAADDSQLPLVRLAAGLEFLSMVGGGQLEQLFGPLAEQVAEGLVEPARDLDAEGLELLEPQAEKSLHRLESLVRQAARQYPELELPLREVLELLRSSRRRRNQPQEFGTHLMVNRALRAIDSSPFDAPDGSWAPAAFESHGSPVRPEDFLDVSMGGPGHVVVRTARHHRGKWVRVLRVAGLVPLALVPLQPEGMVLEALAVVPPDLDLDDLVVQLLLPDELVGPERPMDLVRGAVEAGRAAARYWRLEKYREASSAWWECGRLWREAGDGRRADEARERAADVPNWNRTPPQRPLLADELGPDPGLL